MPIIPNKILPIIILGMVLTSFSHASILVDPAIPSHTRLIYDIEIPQEKEKFEYHNLIDKIVSEEGAAYSITSFVPLASAEVQDHGQTVYLRDPYFPLFCNYDFRNNRKKYSYHKTITWDWKAKKCEIVEIIKDSEKEKRTERTVRWENDPYLDFALIFNGLLDGLPISEEQKETKLKLSFKWFTADVVFRLISREVVVAAGKAWDCYKIEATPDLGILLNWVKLFWGNPKSYIWLTAAKPKIVVKAHIKAPGIERIADLKRIENGNQ